MLKDIRLTAFLGLETLVPISQLCQRGHQQGGCVSEGFQLFVQVILHHIVSHLESFSLCSANSW